MMVFGVDEEKEKRVNERNFNFPISVSPSNAQHGIR
jgi:hypothetical protein